MERGKVQRTLYIIAYDIPVDRRRTRVHKTLSGFGRWTQYSLFECYLSDKELIQLRGKLEPVLDHTQDSVRFYPLCAGCAVKVETVGSAKPAGGTILPESAAVSVDLAQGEFEKAGSSVGPEDGWYPSSKTRKIEND
jgi:CRISPR-associated protein Cas2